MSGKSSLIHVISIHAPRAGSDANTSAPDQLTLDFNPRSPCGERRRKNRERRTVLQISIHAPRAGSDLKRKRGADRLKRISIHAPRAGSDILTEFALTIPANFNPRSPCGERHCLGVFALHLPFISIHAPRAGSDRHWHNIVINGDKFQSTLPVRGATHQQHRRVGSHSISIHAPRAGSDLIKLDVPV